MVLTLLPTVQTPLGSPRASQVRAVLAKMDVPTHLPEGRKRKAVAQSLGKKNKHSQDSMPFGKERGLLRPKIQATRVQT